MTLFPLSADYNDIPVLPVTDPGGGTPGFNLNLNFPGPDTSSGPNGSGVASQPGFFGLGASNTFYPGIVPYMPVPNIPDIQPYSQAIPMQIPVGGAPAMAPMSTPSAVGGTLLLPTAQPATAAPIASPYAQMASPASPAPALAQPSTGQTGVPQLTGGVEVATAVPAQTVPGAGGSPLSGFAPQVYALMNGSGGLARDAINEALYSGGGEPVLQQQTASMDSTEAPPVAPQRAAIPVRASAQGPATQSTSAQMPGNVVQQQGTPSTLAHMPDPEESPTVRSLKQKQEAVRSLKQQQVDLLTQFAMISSQPNALPQQPFSSVEQGIKSVDDSFSQFQQDVEKAGNMMREQLAPHYDLIPKPDMGLSEQIHPDMPGRSPEFPVGQDNPVMNIKDVGNWHMKEAQRLQNPNVAATEAEMQLRPTLANARAMYDRMRHQGGGMQAAANYYAQFLDPRFTYNQLYSQAYQRNIVAANQHWEKAQQIEKLRGDQEKLSLAHSRLNLLRDKEMNKRALDVEKFIFDTKQKAYSTYFGGLQTSLNGRNAENWLIKSEVAKHIADLRLKQSQIGLREHIGAQLRGQNETRRHNLQMETHSAIRDQLSANAQLDKEIAAEEKKQANLKKAQK